MSFERRERSSGARHCFTEGLNPYSEPDLQDQLVYLVDDDPAVLESLQWLMESAGFAVAAFASPTALLEQLPELPRGCLVIDLRLPGISGIDVIRGLRERGVHLPAMVITGHGDVTAAVRAMQAGAIDFIEKPFDEALLLDRVRAALTMDQDQAASTEHLVKVRSLYARLTPRERQVMGQVVRGNLNKQIAADLGLSPKTIEVHRAHVMDKMKAGSLAELVRMSIVLESQSSS